MYILNTVEQLVKYGMEKQMADMLVHSDALPPMLNAHNDLPNLKLLVRHMDLNDPQWEMAGPFLKRDHAVNLRLESIPEFFRFPEKDAAAYLSQPLFWNRDFSDWFACEQALKLIFTDEAQIREILIHMFIHDDYVDSAEFCAICLKLAENNTDSRLMNILVSNFHSYLFSSYAHTVNCIDSIIRSCGHERLLAELIIDPSQPMRWMRNRGSMINAEKNNRYDPKKPLIPN